VQAARDGRSGLMLGWRSITRGLVAEGALVEWPGGAQDFGTAYFVATAPGSARKSAVADVRPWLTRWPPSTGIDPRGPAWARFPGAARTA